MKGIKNIKVTQVLGTNNYHVVNMHVLEPMLSVNRYYEITIAPKAERLVWETPEGIVFEAVVRKVEFLNGAVKLILSVQVKDANWLNMNLEHLQGSDDSLYGAVFNPIKSSSIDSDFQEKDDEEEEMGDEEEVKPKKKTKK